MRRRPGPGGAASLGGGGFIAVKLTLTPGNVQKHTLAEQLKNGYINWNPHITLKASVWSVNLIFLIFFDCMTADIRWWWSLSQDGFLSEIIVSTIILTGATQTRFQWRNTLFRSGINHVWPSRPPLCVSRGHALGRQDLRTPGEVALQAVAGMDGTRGGRGPPVQRLGENKSRDCYSKDLNCTLHENEDWRVIYCRLHALEIAISKRSPPAASCKNLSHRSLGNGGVEWRPRGGRWGKRWANGAR